MTWVRIDDTLWSHPKMLELPAGAVRLWLFALCWSGQQMSDGRVSHACVRLLGGKKTDVKSLVSAGLWDIADDGFQIHDYLEYQTPRSKVQAEREAAKERMRRVRSGEHDPNFARSSPTRSHPIPSHTEQVTCKGGSKDLTGQSDPPRPEDTPAHVRKLERSFWPTVHLWQGPTDAHRTFARQNGLDVELEAKQYRANRRKCDFRCADFNADFEEWLAKSLKFARRTPAASSSDSEHTRELNDADKAAIAKARRAARRAMEGA